MKKIIILFKLHGAVIRSFAVNSVNWEILRNPVDGESGFPMTASGRQLFVDFTFFCNSVWTIFVCQTS